MAEHVVAHLRGSGAFLTEAEPASWLWGHLRALYPKALAAVLMPNHLQVLVRKDGAELGRLRHLLAAFGRHFGLRNVWRPIPEPHAFTTTDKILRQIRYIHLNPCRPCAIGEGSVKLANDPLAWEWSTHRDLVGAIADPWVTPLVLAPLGTPITPSWWHHYVSADPHVAVEGTPFPIAGPGARMARVPLERVLHAAAASRRVPLDAVKRKGPTRNTFVDLALRERWTNTTELADIIGTTRQPVHRLKGRAEAGDIEAAQLCLGDDRLLVRTSYTPDPYLLAVGLAAARKS